MLRFHICKILIKSHRCPRKCLGNICQCDSILDDIQEKFPFFYFLFFFHLSPMISAVDCFYCVLDSKIQFLGNERISCLRRSFPATLENKYPFHPLSLYY